MTLWLTPYLPRVTFGDIIPQQLLKNYELETRFKLTSCCNSWIIAFLEVRSSSESDDGLFGSGPFSIGWCEFGPPLCLRFWPGLGSQTTWKRNSLNFKLLLVTCYVKGNILLLVGHFLSLFSGSLKKVDGTDDVTADYGGYPKILK